MSISEKRAYELGLIDKPLRSKFNVSKNKENRTCHSGHVHASEKECMHCDTLRLMLRNGEIGGYEVEVKFELQPGFYPSEHSNKVAPIFYRADFVVYHNGILHGDGTHEIIDVKGMETAVFKLKWKMLMYNLRGSRREYVLTII